MQTGTAVSSDEDYDWLVVELKPGESFIAVSAKHHLDGWHFVRDEVLPHHPAPLLHFKRLRTAQKKAPSQ